MTRSSTKHTGNTKDDEKSSKSKRSSKGKTVLTSRIKTRSTTKDTNKQNDDESNDNNANATTSAKIDTYNPNTSYQYSAPADDIDARDAHDPLCVASYAQDMYEHFRHKELETSVRSDYMKNQTFVNERIRSILVDWLVDQHLKFKLVPETLFLTVNLIDRYLVKTDVPRRKFQLVGVTALFIASKYEETFPLPLDLQDLVDICDTAYSRNDILDMEETILNKLEYKISIPSAYAFLARYLKAAHADKMIV
jgi:cyclin B